MGLRFNQVPWKKILFYAFVTQAAILFLFSACRAHWKLVDARGTVDDCDSRGGCVSPSLSEVLATARHTVARYWIELWYEEIWASVMAWMWWVPAAWEHPYLAVAAVAGTCVLSVVLWPLFSVLLSQISSVKTDNVADEALRAASALIQRAVDSKPVLMDYQRKSPYLSSSYHPEEARSD